MRDDCPKLRTFVSIDDDTDEDLSTIGAVEYEAALAAASPDRDFAPRSPDDLYILYTGGTTGMPKGVMWRQDDYFNSTIGALMRMGGATVRVRRRGRRRSRGIGRPRRLPPRPTHARRGPVGRDDAPPAGEQGRLVVGPSTRPDLDLADDRAREGDDDEPGRRRHGTPAHRGTRRPGARRHRPVELLRDRLGWCDPLPRRQGGDREAAPERRRDRLARGVGDGLPGHPRGFRFHRQAALRHGRAHHGARRRRQAGRARRRRDRSSRPQGLHADRVLQGSRRRPPPRSSRSTANGGRSPATWRASRKTAPSRCSDAAR